jgi:hypothetical protein
MVCGQLLCTEEKPLILTIDCITQQMNQYANKSHIGSYWRLDCSRFQGVIVICVL